MKLLNNTMNFKDLLFEVSKGLSFAIVVLMLSFFLVMRSQGQSNSLSDNMCWTNRATGSQYCFFTNKETTKVENINLPKRN